MTTWNPTQYLLFGNERLRPALDLLARIPSETPNAVYDLGCGTGAATVLLKERWPHAHVTGVDSSAEMLARARALGKDIAWEAADLAAWQPDTPADVFFSNAAFHWLDGHDTLFPHLLKGLKSGGALAVQMPQNFSAPTHTSISDTVRGGPWRRKLEPLLREHPTHEASVYYDILCPHVASLDIWETTYHHVLSGENPVVEWTKGSILRPLLAQLDEAEARAFLEDYGARVCKAYPQGRDGKTVLPFKRLFFIAVR
ncbi:MAG: methyltransferase domain-containing protein [Chloroflexi bacterium]|nr:methyltransferase domain-containing protein [Chloroflexota bacterium]